MSMERYYHVLSEDSGRNSCKYEEHGPTEHYHATIIHANARANKVSGAPTRSVPTEGRMYGVNSHTSTKGSETN